MLVLIGGSAQLLLLWLIQKPRPGNGLPAKYSAAGGFCLRLPSVRVTALPGPASLGPVRRVRGRERPRPAGHPARVWRTTAACRAPAVSGSGPSRRTTPAAAGYP